MTSTPNDPSTPWDIDAAEKVKTGISLEQARDQIALEWLQDGDVSALALFLIAGHVPGAALLNNIGWSLLGEDNATNLPAGLSKHLPYQLKASRRSGQKGRPVSPKKKTLNRLLARNMKTLIDVHGFKYEAAVQRIIEAAKETGATIGEKTIRNAYDARYGKKTPI